MPITPPDWHAADKAYQLRHINRPHAAPLALPLVQGSGARQGWSCGAHINRREIRRTSPGCAGRKEPVFQKPVVTVTPVLGQDLIGHDTDIYGQVSRQVANLQDQIVRDQLIAAGLTPPRAESSPTVAHRSARHSSARRSSWSWTTLPCTTFGTKASVGFSRPGCRSPRCH